jgi:hypothetical protein
VSTPDPALLIPRPDAEWAVHRAVAHLGGTVTWAYATSGTDPAGWLSAVEVQVDAHAATKRAAYDRADQVRRAVSGLPWIAGLDGTFAAVDVIDGPYWNPADTGAPVYTTRFRVYLHPSRSGAGRSAAALPADPLLDIPRPDVEWLVREVVRPLGGTVTWVYATSDGGRLGPRGWASTLNVQVDVRANSKRAAYRRADEVRRAVCLLPFRSPASAGVVASADVTDGPAWMPDGVGHPRYVVRFALVARPARGRLARRETV